MEKKAKQKVLIGAQIMEKFTKLVEEGKFKTSLDCKVAEGLIDVGNNIMGSMGH